MTGFSAALMGAVNRNKDGTENRKWPLGLTEEKKKRNRSEHFFLAVAKLLL